jgi:hypothetical protein
MNRYPRRATVWIYVGFAGSSPSACRSSETAWVNALSVTATSGHNAENSSSLPTSADCRATRYRSKSMIFGERGMTSVPRCSRYELASTVKGPKRYDATMVIEFAEGAPSIALRDER